LLRLPAIEEERAAVPPIRVAGVVPLPSELGGQGELLVVAAFGGARLPSGDLLPNERILDGAVRVVQQVTGARVTPERIVFLLERVAREWVIGVLCGLAGEGSASDTRPGARFVSLVGGTLEFDPPALRDLLIEDAHGGFVRPSAHITIVTDDLGGETVSVAW
jgi:hypothetical protein